MPTNLNDPTIGILEGQMIAAEMALRTLIGGLEAVRPQFNATIAFAQPMADLQKEMKSVKVGSDDALRVSATMEFLQGLLLR